MNVAKSYFGAGPAAIYPALPLGAAGEGRQLRLMGAAVVNAHAANGDGADGSGAAMGVLCAPVVAGGPVHCDPLRSASHVDRDATCPASK